MSAKLWRLTVPSSWYRIKNFRDAVIRISWWKSVSSFGTHLAQSLQNARQLRTISNMVPFDTEGNLSHRLVIVYRLSERISFLILSTISSEITDGRPDLSSSCTLVRPSSNILHQALMFLYDIPSAPYTVFKRREIFVGITFSACKNRITDAAYSWRHWLLTRTFQPLLKLVEWTLNPRLNIPFAPSFLCACKKNHIVTFLHKIVLKNPFLVLFFNFDRYSTSWIYCMLGSFIGHTLCWNCS